MASSILAGLMVALSYGWRARLYRNPWDYRFTGFVFALHSAAAIFAGWYESRHPSEPDPKAESVTPVDPGPTAVPPRRRS
jgi:hypothetical protein